MVKIIGKLEKNNKTYYLYEPSGKYLKFSRPAKDMQIMAGTIENFEPTSRTEFRKIVFDIDGSNISLDLLYGDISPEVYDTNPLYFSFLKLYRSIKDTPVFSNNRILHGRNFLQIVPTVDGFSIIVYIDLMTNIYSENQWYLDITDDQYSKVYRALNEFYNELEVIATKESVPSSIISALGRLITMVMSINVDFTPQKGTAKEFVKQKKENVA